MSANLKKYDDGSKRGVCGYTPSTSIYREERFGLQTVGFLHRISGKEFKMPRYEAEHLYELLGEILTVDLNNQTDSAILADNDKE